MDHFREPVKTDCEELLFRFQATESVRYEQFLESWRDMDFSSIFHGKPEPNERRRFARLILSLASPYFFPPYIFQIRVGGLYLLYGLFNTQLATPREKIRIALKDWKDVMPFQKDAVNAQHYDHIPNNPFVIGLTAQSDGKAFINHVGEWLLCDKDGRRRKICEEFVDPPSRPQELVSTDVLEVSHHGNITGLKKAIFTEPDPNLNIVQQNLVPKLNIAVFAYSNWQMNDAVSICSSSRAQLLALIKSKSYGQVIEVKIDHCIKRSRRHRQTELVPAAGPDISLKVKSCPPRSTHVVTVWFALIDYRHFYMIGNESEGSNLTRLWCLSAVKEEKEPVISNSNPTSVTATGHGVTLFA
uniref:Small nuclear RNA activating complex, polypeptide 1b n=1 Tax=Sinocyclocheilus anshuiensis TaxID=1608454 RepID=A0A671LEF0_9TELE